MNAFGRTLATGIAAIAFALLLGLTAGAQVGITINGNGVDVSPSPIIQAGRVFVPLRGVFENLGASVVYNSGQINATGNGRDISLQIGSTQANVDGQSQSIDVAPFIVGESTYVPLRFVSQALGASVSWNEQDRVVSISLAGAEAMRADHPRRPDNQDGDWVDAPPPPIPYYEPPPVPQPNDIWIPGYWAWGEAGYYWVPGYWSQPPQTGYLWTPGYWAANNGSFVFHQGYWGITIGFYGGINYGAGYYGNGYVGGRWAGNVFRYNTAVTPVNRTVITNVYVDRTVVINNTTVNHVSYNGGSGGVTARPTSAQLAAPRTARPPTPQQQQHVQAAAQDRRNLATANAGKPPVVVAPQPLKAAVKPAGFTPVTPSDRVAAQKLVPRAPVAAQPAPAYQRPAAAAPPAAVVRPAPAPPAAVVRPAPAPPAAVIRPAPAPPAAVVRPAPAPPAAVVRPAAAPPVAVARPAPVAAPVYVHHAPPVPAVPVARAAAVVAPVAAPAVRVAPAARPAPAAPAAAAAAPAAQVHGQPPAHRPKPHPTEPPK